MLPFEKSISPLIENLFPDFYFEEGPNFIAFVKAYYEWLETPTQTLTLTDTTDFNVGDTVEQLLGSDYAHGTILLAMDGQILVELASAEHFRCMQRCGVLSNITSSSGGVTTIEISTSDNVIFQSRSLSSYRDIDETIDKFILHFKEKYLKNIQFNTATNKKLLVKNSFDLYRSKGTSRSIDLFFKLVYSIDSEVYYPGDDIFRLSDGQWVRPKYLEITDTDRSIDYVGKQITGVTSGATAFVEKYIKRRIEGAIVNILYVSNPSGTFINGELLKSDKIYSNSPKLIGSMSSVEIISGSRLYNVGDTVKFTSSRGGGGQARVSSIANTSGVVDFLLIDGGWGYTVNAETIVSEKTLTLANISASNTKYYNIFENVSQPLANITFVSANNDFTLGDNIYRYYANNTVAGVGKVVALTQTEGSANGELTVSTLSGSFIGSGRFYKASNTIVANSTAYVDKSVTAKIMGISNSAVLTVNVSSGVIPNKVEIYQANSTSEYANAYVDVSSGSGGVYTLSVSNSSGVFKVGSDNVQVRDSTVNGSLSAVSLAIGVYDIGNTFNFNGAYLNSQNTGTTALVVAASSGSGADFSVSGISDIETVYINTDLLGSNNVGYVAANSTIMANQTFMSIPLAQYAYGFPKKPQGNSASIIFSCLGFSSYSLGSIATIGSLNPGVDYNTDPFVLINQPYISNSNRKDYVVSIANATKAFIEGEKILQTSESLQRYILTVGNSANFVVGEKIYQGTIGLETATGIISVISSSPNTFIVDSVTGTFSTSSNVKSYISVGTANVSVANQTTLLSTAAGIVKSGSNTTNLYVKRIQFNNTFRDGQTIVGQTSGASATISSITEDANTMSIGLNAEVNANVVTSNGTVTSLQIFDSGFGYRAGEIIQYAKEDGELGDAKVIIDGIGTGAGYFKSSKGFLSSNKYIHDGDYYQEYSYEIFSKLPFEKYADVFKKVMHTAGTKFFGSVVITDEDAIQVRQLESEIEETVG